MSKVLIKIYRNKPAGIRCNELTINLLKALAEIVEKTDKEIVLEIKNFPEDVTEISAAPSLIINEKKILENPLLEEIRKNYSKENLKKILEEYV